MKKKIELLLSKVKFEVKFIDRVQYVFVNGEDVSEKIRTAEVSIFTSLFAKSRAVR